VLLAAHQGEERQRRQDARDHRPQKDLAHRDAPQEQRRRQRSEDGPDGVHRAVKADRPSERRLLSNIGQHRRARRPAQPLGQPADHARQQQVHPALRQPEQADCQAGDEIAGDGQRLTPRQPVGQRAAVELAQRDHAVSNPLDEPERRRCRPEHREQRRHRRRARLVPEVRQQAGDAEAEDRRGQPADLGRASRRPTWPAHVCPGAVGGVVRIGVPAR
jgi:hypothetical protein